MYFGVGRYGKGYSSLSLNTHTHTHTHTVGEMENFKFLTIVVRKCVEIFFYENKDDGPVNAN